MKLVNHKNSIALEHLRAAIRLYQEGSAYYSAIHLAAASEEILGQIIKYVRGETPTRNDSNSDLLKQYLDISIELAAILDGSSISKKEIAELRKEVFSSKNYVKHLNEITEPMSEFSPKLEARTWLFRAISNLEWLTENLEVDIDSFLNTLRAEETEEAFELHERLILRKAQ